MRAVAPASLIAILMVSPGQALAQEYGARWQQPNYLSWSGTADWEYYRSAGSSQGVENDFSSFRQKYSLLVNGSLWDPRFNRYSLGLDAFRTDRESTGDAPVDSDNLGYRAQTTFFPGRPFPLRLYARRSATDVSGTALANNDRETAAWGAEWNLSTRRLQKLRLLLDRTSFDLLSPVSLQERRKTGLVDFMNRFGKSEIALRYDFQDQKERVNATEFTRQTLTLTDRTGFENGSTLLVNTSQTRSDALFSSGLEDELTTSRLSTRLDMPRGDRVRLGLSYDFNDNTGQFLDSTSHVLRSQNRFRLHPRWESTATLMLGQVESETSAGLTQQDQAGARASLRYHREGERVRFSAAYAVGYDAARSNIDPDRRSVTHHADVDTRVDLGEAGELFSALARSQDENDTSGLGYSFDETRASVGWERSFGGRRKVQASLSYRASVRDTFQFGVQESAEIALTGSLTLSRGGLSMSLSTSDGVSDFLPDPGSGSTFLPGTDLVSKADVATVGLFWMVLRQLRFRMDARLENRSFTTIGKENIASLHPEIEYVVGEWRIIAGYSRYGRRNSTTFSDDTFLLRVSRRFF